MAGSLFLDGPEGYFDQHKQRSHGSSTPFSRAPPIEYEQFVGYIQESKGLHAHPRAFVASLYRTMFSQWSFELSQGFNLLFYGVGSKRDLVMEFVEQALDLTTLVVNGYNPATTLKEILNSSVSALVPDERTRKAFPKTPTELVNALVRHMDTARAE
jgi:origin recognition complex subunit 2